MYSYNMQTFPSNQSQPQVFYTSGSGGMAPPGQPAFSGQHQTAYRFPMQVHPAPPGMQNLQQHHAYQYPPPAQQIPYQPPPYGAVQPNQMMQPGYRPPPPQAMQPGYRPPPPQQAQPQEEQSGSRPPPPQEAQPEYRPPQPQEAKPGSRLPQPQEAQPEYRPSQPREAQPDYRYPPPQAAQPGYKPPSGTFYAVPRTSSEAATSNIPPPAYQQTPAVSADGTYVNQTAVEDRSASSRTRPPPPAQAFMNDDEKPPKDFVHFSFMVATFVNPIFGGIALFLAYMARDRVLAGDFQAARPKAKAALALNITGICVTVLAFIIGIAVVTNL